MKQILRVGTDCSGVEAPLVALQAFKQYQIQHIFSSEINQTNINFINHHFKPKIMYGDITQRDHRLVPPVDLYVAGFPCQSFSNLNRKHALGLDDPTKGTILYHCIKTIEATQPKYFVLENVRAILWHDHHQTFPRVCQLLASLTNYQIKYKVLNTKDYGVPQSRNRIYWVGVHRSTGINFEFPEPVYMRPITEFLEPNPEIIRLTPKRQQQLDRFFEAFPRHNRQSNYTIALYNTSLSWYRPMYGVVPCITTVGPYYISWLDRCMTTRELFNLQGFPNDFPIDTLSIFHAGNTMSVNVLICLFNQLI
jgi:DNA-cytosine methyltransferase